MQRQLYKSSFWLLLALSLTIPALLSAQSISKDPKASLSNSFQNPIQLADGTELTLISPENWNPIAQNISTIVTSTHKFFSEVFGPIPAFNTTVQLMSEENFFEATGAPRWTNAMYFKGQIIIPLGANAKADMQAVYRAVRHEFTHAVIHALSAGRCPGWVDEGLAQWAEGEENQALKPALLEWLNGHPIVPFQILQGGFTKLDPAMVPAAYAQSLYAASGIISTFGFKRLRNYMDFLRQGNQKLEAFEAAFGVSEAEFELRFGRVLKGWIVK